MSLKFLALDFKVVSQKFSQASFDWHEKKEEEAKTKDENQIQFSVEKQKQMTEYLGKFCLTATQ